MLSNIHKLMINLFNLNYNLTERCFAITNCLGNQVYKLLLVGKCVPFFKYNFYFIIEKGNFVNVFFKISIGNYTF